MTMPCLFQRRLAGEAPPPPRTPVSYVATNKRHLSQRNFMAAVEAASAASRVPVKDILSRSNFPAHSHPRQHAMWLLRQAGYSYPQIGRWLERDHSTIINGVRAHERRPLKISPQVELLSQCPGAENADIVAAQ